MNTEPNSAVPEGCAPPPCSASSFQRMRWVFGWLIRLNYDREGWWITDAQGYRNTLSLAYTVITDSAGQKARRIIAWRVMLEWAYPQNKELRNGNAVSSNES